MTNRIIVILMVLCTGSIAQVNLTGTVSDFYLSTPISGVVVTLVKKNLSDTTDTTGKYQITSPTNITNSSASHVISGNSLVGNRLMLTILKTSPVTVELFNAAGVKITTLFRDRTLSIGTYGINLSTLEVTTGLYFIRVRQGNQYWSQRYLPIQTGFQGNVTSNSIESSRKAMAKKSGATLLLINPFDTLVFSKIGYGTVTLPLFSYTGKRDVSLTALPTPKISRVTVGDGSVIIEWTTVSVATSYNLYYGTGTSVNMTSGTKLAGVTSPKQVTGLVNGTQYSFAVLAVLPGGDSSLSSTVTATPQRIADTDGNVYDAVTIGTQVWMLQNLKTTKYNDGTSIPLITDSTAWGNLSTPGCCWYNNEPTTYKNSFGALYNWYAVNTGKLAPTGWHVPSDSEWSILMAYLGGEAIAGGPLKDTAFTYWAPPNTGATNASGFTAIPAGYRDLSGIFDFIGSYGDWWSSTAFDASTSWSRFMGYNTINADRNPNNKSYGFSVRCVKDP